MKTGTAFDGLVARAFDLIDWTKVQNFIREGVRGKLRVVVWAASEIRRTEQPTRIQFHDRTRFLFASVAQRLRRVWREVQDDAYALERFTEQVRESFTSRDGFSSYYPNDWHEWGRRWTNGTITKLARLLAVYVLRDGGEWDANKELDLMESDRSNGGIRRLD
jgi:hypothetical protein